MSSNKALDSLLQLSNTVISQSTGTIQAAIAKLKRDLAASQKWTKALFDDANHIQNLLEQAILAQYHSSSQVTQELNQQEQAAYYVQLKALETAQVKILSYGHGQKALSQLNQAEINSAPAFRILPSHTSVQKIGRTRLIAYLNISVKKSYINELARALVNLTVNKSNQAWIEQAILFNSEDIGKNAGDASLILSAEGIAHLQDLQHQLEKLLPHSAWRNDTPIGMQRITTGFSYAEWIDLKDDTQESRDNLFMPGIKERHAQEIAVSLTQHLLFDQPVTTTLSNRLIQTGRDPYDSAVLQTSIKNILLATVDARQSSDVIVHFVESPERFVINNNISTEVLFKNIGEQPWLSSEGYVKFVETSPQYYQVTRTQQQDKNSVKSYFLSLNKSIEERACTAFVDIPKDAPTIKFLFIESLNQSSLIVTELNRTTFRIYHSATKSAKDYKNVVMAIDAKDYNNNDKASAYMCYTNGQWKLILQTQSWEESSQAYYSQEPWIQMPIANTGGSGSTAPVYDKTLAEQKIAEERTELQQFLLDVADDYGIGHDNVIDLAYTSGHYSLEHPSIQAWETLRNRISQKISELKEAVDPSSDEYYVYSYIEKKVNSARIADSVWLYQERIKAGESSPADPMSIFSSFLPQDIQARYDRTIMFLQYMDSQEFQSGYELFESQRLTKNGATLSTKSLKEMPVNELKALIIETHHSPAKYGALSHYVNLAQAREKLEAVLNYKDFLYQEILAAGARKDALFMTQSAFMYTAEETIGRCEPFAYLMALALDKGTEYVNSLYKRVYSGTKQSQRNVALFKNALASMHDSEELRQTLALQVPPNKAGAKAPNTFTIDMIADYLDQCRQNTHLLLFTENHAMLASRMVTGTEQEIGFYFYDPNYFQIPCNSKTDFINVFKISLGQNRAQHYKAYGSPTNPEFHVNRIDVNAIKDIEVSSLGLVIDDLVASTDLDLILIEREFAKQRMHDVEVLDKDPVIVRIENELLASRKACALNKSVKIILENHQLISSDWVPIFESAKQTRNKQYQITFVGKNNTKRELTTQDDTLFKLKTYLNEKLRVFKTHYEFRNSEFYRRSLSSNESAHIGISEWLAVQMLIQRLYGQGEWESTISSNLAKALTIHSYVNIAQVGSDILQNAQKFSALVQELAQTGTQGIHAFSHAFARMNGLAALGFGGASILLDVYELLNTQESAQIPVFATQLAFDVAGVSSNIASIVAGMLGASAASTLLSAGGVILGGLAVGMTGLAQAYCSISQQSQSVADYFHMIRTDRAAHGFEYHTQDALLIPKATSIIKKIRIKNGVMDIDFDSQRLYRYHYEFLNAYIPDINSSKSRAIDVYSDLGYQRRDSISIAKEARIILPAMPLYYMRIGYTFMLHVSRTTGPNFDVIDILEKKHPDDFRFQYFSSGIFKRVATGLTLDFVKTEINVDLQDSKQHLLIQDIPRYLHHYITYKITSQANSSTVITLNPGVTIYLNPTTNAATASTTNWILDSGLLVNKEVKVFSDYITIGGLAIYHQASHKNSIWVIGDRGDVKKVNFNQKKVEVVSVNSQEWKKAQSDAQTTLTQHIQSLKQKQQIIGQYLLINDHIYQNEYVGRAYYDTTHNQTLFSRIDSLSSAQAVQLEDLTKQVNSAALLVITRKIYDYKEVIYQSVFDMTDSRYIISSPKLDKLKALQAWLKNETTTRKVLKTIANHVESFINTWNRQLVIWNQGKDSVPKKYKFKTSEDYNINSASQVFDSQEIVKLTTLQANFNAGWVAQQQALATAINPEIARSRFVTSIELAGNNGSYAYFYTTNILNSDTPWIWRTASNTGTINTRYTPLFGGTRIRRAWNEAGIIYISCAYESEEEPEEQASEEQQSQIIYRIQNDRLELTHIFGNPALLDRLEQSSGIESNLTQLLFDCFQSSTPVSINSMGLAGQEVTAILSPLLMLFGQNSAGDTHHYWLRSRDGAVIRPNLRTPNTGSYALSDIEFTGSMLSTKGDEIFYFFDRTRKKIWRQMGKGINGENAELIKVDKLREFLAIGQNFFALTQDGLVMRLDLKNQLHLEGVHVEWLLQHREWRRDLMRFARKHAVTALTIFGIKDKDNNPVPIWYCNGTFVIASSTLQSQSLKFLGMDILGVDDIGLDDGDADLSNEENIDTSQAQTSTASSFSETQEAGVGQYGFLLDTNTGKLYVQAIVDLDGLFQADGITLKDTVQIPPANPIFAEYCFIYAELRNGKPRLITREGEIVIVKKQDTLELIGVSSIWEKNYPDSATLDQALKTLSRRWFNGIEHPFRRNAEGTLIVAVEQSEDFGTMQRLDNIVLIKGTEQADVITPKSFAGADIYCLSGEQNTDIYFLNQIWGASKLVIIDNFDASATSEQDEIQLHVSSFDSLIVLANSIDLWILDTEKHRALVLKKVLSTESKAYGHLEINLDDGTRTLRITVETMIEKLKQPASANSPISIGDKNKVLVDGIVKELEAKVLDANVSSQGEMDPSIIRQVNYLINMTAAYASSGVEQTSLPFRNEPAILIAS